MQKIVLNKKVIFYEVASKSVVDKYSLLKTLAKDTFGIDIDVQKENNKPYIANHKDFFCSVSDSEDVIFVALCKDFQIGIDVEYLHSRKKELREYLCNKDELEILDEVFKGRTELETVAWSIKESVQKSDNIIFDQNKYIIIDYQNQLLKIKRRSNLWTCKTFIKNDYLFCVSIKESVLELGK